MNYAMTQEPVSVPSDWIASHRLLLSGALFLLSLYDIYFTQIGLAPLPIIGMLALLGGASFFARLSDGATLRKHLFTYLIAALMVLLFFISSFWGWIKFGEIFFKGAIGLSLGVVVLAALLSREDNPRFGAALERSLADILILHGCIWLVQFVYFFVGGSYLDFVGMVTRQPSRNLFSGEGFELTRFTGFFAEPAIYSNFIYMGLTIRLTRSGFRFRRMDVLLLLTVLASLSIYGIFLMTVLIVTSVIRSGKGLQLLALPLLPIAVLVGLFTAFADSPVTEFIKSRVMSPFSDASGHTRLVRGFQSIAESPEEIQLLGKGVGNYGQSLGVTNGMAYLLEYLGVFGTLLFFGLFAWLFVLRRVPTVIVFLISLTLLGSPLFTNIYWWFWIGMLVLFSQKSMAGESHPDSA